MIFFCLNMLFDWNPLLDLLCLNSFLLATKIISKQQENEINQTFFMWYVFQEWSIFYSDFKKISPDWNQTKYSRILFEFVLYNFNIRSDRIFFLRRSFSSVENLICSNWWSLSENEIVVHDFFLNICVHWSSPARH